MDIPRNEYPRPQMIREKWINLNGTWQFEFDFGKSGKERGLISKKGLSSEIIVPFCPESSLSGIGCNDFLNAAWYKRNIEVPAEWRNGRVLLNFEAVDYYCEVWINEKFAGSHKGGYTPFSLDISDLLNKDENILTVYVEDDNRTGLQPRGKQSEKYSSQGCDYTRVTGIWQTVWLEYVPESYIKSYKVISDVDNAKVHILANVTGTGTLVANAKFEGREVGRASAKSTGGEVRMSIDLSELHLWEPLNPKLYDFNLSFNHDSIDGYFGMRKLELSNKEVLINGKPVFQRLVLDQGYYPDGIYTAPDDKALQKDIELSLALGFNGARLHQKVFERRFLYHADKMGYLVWGEYGSWGLNHSKAEALEIFLPEWLEAVERDYNSPALIGWCPFNETGDVNGCKQDDEVLRNVYLATKAVDPTRPVIDTSGNFHVKTDIYDVHNYNQNVGLFEAEFAPMINGGDVFENFPARQKYEGQPYFVSEYGGIRWSPSGEAGWGYGDAPETEEEFVNRYIGLAEVLLKNPGICALCYTQLYDVEQEVNGIYNYDRTPKFSDNILKKMREAMQSRAAIEESFLQGR